MFLSDVKQCKAQCFHSSDYTKKMKAIGGMRSSCNHFSAPLLCKQTEDLGADMLTDFNQATNQVTLGCEP